MHTAALSDIGLVRTRNEDSFRCDEERGVFIIADGLGGAQAGEVASSLASERVAARLAEAVDKDPSESELVDEIHQAFRLASEEIHARAEESVGLRGMACSLLAVVVRKDYCLIAHAGDARAYLFYDDDLHQITVDDTPVAAMIKRGYLLPEKARSHAMKNFLLKSVGNKPDVEANLTRLSVKPGDTLLLCSDGLWGMVDLEDMKSIIVDYPDPETACHKLVDAARGNGGKDNITVILARISPVAPEDRTEEMPKPSM